MRKVPARRATSIQRNQWVNIGVRWTLQVSCGKKLFQTMFLRYNDQPERRPLGMGVQVVDEDSVGLTLAKEQESSMRCTRRVPQNTSQCTTFQPQHRLQMFSFAGLYTLFDSQTLCVMLVNSAELHPLHGQRRAGGT